MKKFIALILPASLLVACAPPPTTIIKPLAEAQRGAIDIQNVNVSYGDLTRDTLIELDQKAAEKGASASEPSLVKYQPLKDVMPGIVKQRLETVDVDGGTPANVQIEIDNLKLTNTATVLLVGGVDQITGTSRVYKAGSNELLTEFHVDVIQGSGGLIGLATRGSSVREKLAEDYADFIAKELGFEAINTPIKAEEER